MSDETPDKTSILLETSTVRWHELQKLFASGVVLSLHSELDMIEVAHQMANDDAAAIDALIRTNQIQHVSNDQAKQWYADNKLLWSVVVKPWVLVQDKNR